jgi:hypothetical protein
VRLAQSRGRNEVIVAASDTALYGAYLAAAAAVIPALLAYRRGRRADDRSIAVTELELVVKTMGQELARAQVSNTSLRQDLIDVRMHLQRCEVDKQSQAIEILSLKKRVGDLEDQSG